jgi:hypothetical protein
METALEYGLGLPVTCGYGDCGQKGFVKPRTDYGGWYKSKIFRFKPRKKWFCPNHYEHGRQIDNRFYANYMTPDPYPDTGEGSIEEQLYALLD